MLDLLEEDPIKDFLSKQNNEEKSSFSFYIKNNDSQMILIEDKKTISYYITILQDTLFLMEQGLANNSGITKNDIINDPTNLDFMDYRTIINGGNKRHGDDEYIEHVMQYVDGPITIKRQNDKDIVLNINYTKEEIKTK